MHHLTGTATGHGLLAFPRVARPPEPSGETLAFVRPARPEHLDGCIEAVRAAAAERMEAGDEIEVRLVRRGAGGQEPRAEA